MQSAFSAWAEDGVRTKIYTVWGGLDSTKKRGNGQLTSRQSLKFRLNRDKGRIGLYSQSLANRLRLPPEPSLRFS